MNTDGGYPAEAELLSSHDSHQVIADRLGISANVVRFYCDRLVQSFRLSRCTHGDGTSEQQPSWDPYGQQQDPRQYQGQQYPVQQQPYGYQPLYGQQPRQSSFTPDPQYGTPPGQPSYQHQARYSGTPREQLYSQAPPQQYDSELHRYLRDQYGQWQANPGAWPQPDRRRWSRSLVYAGIAALIVIAGGRRGVRTRRPWDWQCQRGEAAHLQAAV